MKVKTSRARLLAGGAFIAFAAGGYAPRVAMAGSCDENLPNITCSGAADAHSDVQQYISVATSVTVSTAPGFGLNTGGTLNEGGINILGVGAPFTTFTDVNASAIVANRYALKIFGEDVTVESNGSFTSLSGDGVRVEAASASITVTGDIDATDGPGVFVYTENEAYVQLGGDVTATLRGVTVERGSGSGDTTVNTVGGTVTAVQGGIFAEALYSNDLTIIAPDVASTQTPGGMPFSGIEAIHRGNGAVSVSSSGTVSSTTGDGIFGLVGDRGDFVVNNVTGAINGMNIYTNVYGDESGTSITVLGDVSGGTGAGLRLAASSSFTGSVDVNVYGSLSSTSGVALTDDTDDDIRTNLRLHEYGSIGGLVSFGKGNDSFTHYGGDLTTLTAMYGGKGGRDSILVRGDAELTGSKFTGFESFEILTDKQEQRLDGFVAPSATATFADNDSLILDSGYSAVFVQYGGVLQAGNNLAITSGAGVLLDGSRDIYGQGNEVIGVIPGGILRTGGAPGQGLITVNATSLGGISGSGTIDMQNGVPGDNVVVNGGLRLFGGDGNDILRVDIDPAIEGADLVTVRDNVGVYGNINVNVVNITRTGETDHVVIRSTSGTVNASPPLSIGQAVIAPLTASTESVAASVEANVVDNEVIVTVTTDFTPEPPVVPGDGTIGTTGLSKNGVSFGDYLNAVLNDPALADIRELALSATSIEELEAIYASLGGSDFNAPLFSSLEGGLGFGSGLFSCAVGEGQFAPIDEGQCGWTRVGGTFIDRDGSVGNPGGKDSIFSVSAGGQFMVDDHIRLGAGVGFSSIDGDGDLGLKLDGNRIHAGVSAKYVDGPMMVGVSAAGGVTFSDTKRSLATGATAKGSFEIYDLSILARAAYLFDAGNGIYVKPQVQGGVTHVSRDGFTETGAGAANLQVKSESQTFLSFTPSIEVGGDFELDEGMSIRPYVRVGATLLSEDTIDTTARFAASASPATFTTSVKRDDLYGDVAAGFVVFGSGDVSLRAEYQGRFAEDTQSHGGFLKLQIAF